MKTLSFPLLSALLLTCAVITAAAQQTGTVDVPRTISYQGVLTANDGTPLPDGTYDITVSLFLDEAGTQPLWNATFNTDVRNGVFNILLGNDQQPLPAPLQMNRPLWVGTAVNGSPLMRPLSPLTASPYALNLPDRTVSTAKLADGAVTAEKMGTPYVAGIALNGKTITADGSVLNIEVGEGIALTYDEETRTLKLSKSAAAVQGDEKKGAETQDFVSLTENWIGRQNDDGTTRANPPIIRGTSYNTIAGGYNTLIDTLSDFSTIGGGYHNTIDTNSDYSFIGGGDTNLIDYNGDHSTIAGGGKNIIGRASYYGMIGGGEQNLIEESTIHAAIVGGKRNTIKTNSYGSVIGGGVFNTIDEFSPNSVISGGDTNYIGQEAEWSTIAGGHNNTIHSDHGFIGSGHYDTIFGIAGVIGGGWLNRINATYGMIGGGERNYINANHSAVSGGYRDTIIGIAGFIGGGRVNNINSSYSIIGGGDTNTVDASYGAIVGGDSNLIAIGDYSIIGGGDRNKIRSESGVIVGGRLNVLGTTSGASNHSVIGGGDTNTLDGANGFIGGGRKNTIAAFNGVIGGGRWNVIEAGGSVIGGGFGDTIMSDAYESFIGGGTANRIRDGAYLSVINGGNAHVIDVDASFSTIGGGSAHLITSPAGATETATLATIPGGDNLIAQSWAQTIIGGWNIAKGSVPFRYQGTHDKNDPIFIVGNGYSDQNRSNAFEVSYNGHSIVYHQNNTGATTPAIRGGTYTDNVVYAWAYAIPQAIPPKVTVQCDFGVGNIAYVGMGHYRVVMNLINPDGTPMTINCGSVTATPVSQGRECFFINTTPINNNTFDIYISDPNCGPEDTPFTFKVTGVPSGN